jgi:hypothetical protein
MNVPKIHLPHWQSRRHRNETPIDESRQNPLLSPAKSTLSIQTLMDERPTSTFSTGGIDAVNTTPNPGRRRTQYRWNLPVPPGHDTFSETGKQQAPRPAGLFGREFDLTFHWCVGGCEWVGDSRSQFSLDKREHEGMRVEEYGAGVPELRG